MLSAKEYSLDKSSYIVTYLGKKYQVSKDALRSPGDVELLYKRKMADQDALDRKNNLRLTQIENELLALYVTNLELKRDTALVYQEAVLRQNAQGQSFYTYNYRSLLSLSEYKRNLETWKTAFNKLAKEKKSLIKHNKLLQARHPKILFNVS